MGPRPRPMPAAKTPACRCAGPANGQPARSRQDPWQRDPTKNPQVLNRMEPGVVQGLGLVPGSEARAALALDQAAHGCRWECWAA